MAETAGQFTLLLVDDNPTNLLLLAQIVELDLPEVRVLTARSGKEGLVLAAQQPVDGAFIDVQMPQMSGLQMCRALQADPRTAGMPVVLITAHLASAEMRAEGLAVGAYDFISQPISNIEMLARIRVMLRLCRGEQQQRRDRQQLQQQIDEHSEKLRWLSGLVLSGDGPLAEPDQQLLRQLAADFPDPTELTEQLLVEKLSCDFPLPWRRTLFKLALLDEVPLLLARKLSEITDIEAVFAYLRRHDLSLQPVLSGDDLFHFRPQVLSWLREQALQALTPEECRQVLSLAADWYQQQGQPVAALGCLVRGENYPAISQLFSQAGLELLLDRYQPEVAELLGRIPETTATGCGWMALYLGSSLMQRQPQEVAAWLELARTRFVDAGDKRGELLTMSQQVIQYLLIDGRLEPGRQQQPGYQQLFDEIGHLLEPINRIKVLISFGFAELFFNSRLEQANRITTELLAETLVLESPELQLESLLLRVLLASYQGRLRVGRATLEQAKTLIGQLSRLSWPVFGLQVVAAELLFACGELDAFRRQLRTIEQRWGKGHLSQTAFGPLLSFLDTLGQVAKGDYAGAGERLELGLTEGPAAYQSPLRGWLLQLRGLLNGLAGQVPAGREAIARGLELRQRSGGELFDLTNLLLAGASYATLEDYPQAADCLHQALQRSQHLGEEKLRTGLHAWLALVCLRQGDAREARRHLQHLLELLGRQRIGFFFALTPELLKELLPLLAGEAGYQAQLQRLAVDWLGSGLAENGRLLPLLQVQTLGGFSLWRNGEPVLDLCEVGQASRQMLAMLLTAPGHSLSFDLLMGQLWPQSPASKARSSFDTALSRLRRAIDRSLGEKGSRDYLVLEKGMLLLRQVQIDALDYSRSVERARRQLQRQDDWQAEQSLWQAERLWKGEFLAGFDLQGELNYQQGLLTDLRLEQLVMLARLLQKQLQYDAAERLLRDGLRLDGTYESLVRQLLEIAAKRGDQRQRQQIVEDYRQALREEDYAADEIEEILESLGALRTAP